MEYSIDYTVKEEHIDIQGIMDGLYYPFYMEDCRHKFAKDVMKFDIEEEAKNGINIVLSGYTIRFLRSLKKDDNFRVTCSLLKDKDDSSTTFYLKQQIFINKKIYTEAIFSVTCVLSSGGRAFIPEKIKAFILSSIVNE